MRRELGIAGRNWLSSWWVTFVGCKAAGRLKSWLELFIHVYWKRVSHRWRAAFGCRWKDFCRANFVRDCAHSGSGEDFSWFRKWHFGYYGHRNWIEKNAGVTEILLFSCRSGRWYYGFCRRAKRWREILWTYCLASFLYWEIILWGAGVVAGWRSIFEWIGTLCDLFQLTQ